MTGKLKNLAWYWGPLLAYAAIIFALSSMSQPPVPDINLPHFDKLLHFCEYGGLGLLTCRALALGGAGLSPTVAMIAAALLGALYGASDEFHQMYVPQRSADLFDLLTDFIGASAGAFVYWRLRLRAPLVGKRFGLGGREE